MCGQSLCDARSGGSLLTAIVVFFALSGKPLPFLQKFPVSRVVLSLKFCHFLGCRHHRGLRRSALVQGVQRGRSVPNHNGRHARCARRVLHRVLHRELGAALSHARAAPLRPPCLSCMCYALSQVLWSRQSSGAVPFGTLIAIISLWCLVSAPLVFIGSFIGFKREAQDYPCRTNTIPRQVFHCSFFLLFVHSRSLLHVNLPPLLPCRFPPSLFSFPPPCAASSAVRHPLTSLPLSPYFQQVSCPLAPCSSSFSSL